MVSLEFPTKKPLSFRISPKGFGMASPVQCGLWRYIFSARGVCYIAVNKAFLPDATLITSNYSTSWGLDSLDLLILWNLKLYALNVPSILAQDQRIKHKTPGQSCCVRRTQFRCNRMDEIQLVAEVADSKCKGELLELGTSPHPRPQQQAPRCSVGSRS